MELRIGQGYDLHRLVPGRKLILGGVEIDHSLGLSGHSDADVLTHAIIDALLGAAAMEDIGTLFPDTDPKYKDSNSILLLVDVKNMLADRGWLVANIDSTVVAQKPKLRPYIEKIRENLAKNLGIELSRISVKAKTNEQVGAEGREEAMSAQAVALIRSA